MATHGYFLGEGEPVSGERFGYFDNLFRIVCGPKDLGKWSAYPFSVISPS